MQLGLSVFCNLIDILGKAFERNGFCVVQAGDIRTGQDIRKQHFPRGKFDFVIGGSPCQDFSKARRTPPTGYGLEMIKEFDRVVYETGCKWFLFENVPTVPDLQIEGYHIQRFDLSPLQCGGIQSRPRHFQFGSLDGLILDIPRDKFKGRAEPCVMATEGGKTDRRAFEKLCALQDLPEDFKIWGFTQKESYNSVGEAVNYKVGCRIAISIRDATEGGKGRHFTDTNLCACGCGRILRGREKSSTPACRKRLQKKRERALASE